MPVRKPLNSRKIPDPSAPSNPPKGAKLARRPPKPVDQATLVEIFRRFRDANPEPKGELEHRDPYTLLVAVVLSAQATDAGVNKATRELFRVADTPQKMLALGEDGVREHIKSIDFLNTKARNIIALSRLLVEEHGSIVPPARAVLESLPGVGRKSASVVLNVAFGEPTIAVDTHIFRVSNRIPLVVAVAPDETQMALEKVVPDEFKLHAHHWLILHGRYVCVARKPKCPVCIIRDLCEYAHKTREEEATGAQRSRRRTIGDRSDLI